jgi:hypothetical protein
MIHVCVHVWRVFLKVSPYKNKSSVEMLYLCGMSKKSCFINFKSIECWDGLKKYLMNLQEDLVIFLVVNILCFYKKKLEINTLFKSKMCFLVKKLSLWWIFLKKWTKRKEKPNVFISITTSTHLVLAHSLTLHTKFPCMYILLNLSITYWPSSLANLLEDFVVTHNFF